MVIARCLNVVIALRFESTSLSAYFSGEFLVCQTRTLYTQIHYSERSKTYIRGYIHVLTYQKLASDRVFPQIIVGYTVYTDTVYTGIPYTVRT